MKKRLVSSKAIGAPSTPRSLRKSATSFSGSSSSCQTRTSAGMPRLSRTEGFSKKGVTMIGSPRAGMTAAVSRSSATIGRR